MLLRAALKSLSSQTQKKLDIYLADQIELRRQYEEMLWQESFLSYQNTVLTPENYLQSYYRYCQRKDEIIKNSDFKMGSAEPDLVVKGNVYVTTKHDMKSSKKMKDLENLFSSSVMMDFSKFGKEEQEERGINLILTFQFMIKKTPQQMMMTIVLHISKKAEKKGRRKNLQISLKKRSRRQYSPG